MANPLAPAFATYDVADNSYDGRNDDTHNEEHTRNSTSVGKEPTSRSKI